MPPRTRARTVCLTMIVRDEEKVIGRAVESARLFIDTFLIVDTGSVDGTAIAAATSLTGIPGRVVRDNWVDFGANRTRAINAARDTGADYLLILDADMTLSGVLPELGKDVYDVPVEHGDFRWKLPLLIRAALPWRYIGAAHAYLDCNGRKVRRGDGTSLLVTHHGDGKPHPAKSRRDVLLLERAVREDPTDKRSTFYLAQSYKDCGMLNAAAGMYERRVNLGGAYSEEIFYAHWQWGEMLLRLGRHQEAVQVLEQAWWRRTTRVEPLRSLERAQRLLGQDKTADRTKLLADRIPVPDDLLFVHGAMYAASRPSQ